MVNKTTSFSVQLIDADTRVPFKEHTGNDGKIYVEVEPEKEYFIKASSSLDPKKTKVRVTCAVDEEELGYYNCLWQYSKNTVYNGYAARKNGKTIETSLKFAKTKVCRDPNSDLISQLLMGKVAVTFSEAIPDGKDDVNDFETNLSEENVAPSSKGVHTKKVNDLDTYLEGEADDITYKEGTCLAKIELDYCCTLGLIRHNILPKPPLWDFHRLMQSKERTDAEDSSHLLKIEPKRLKISPPAVDGKSLGAEKYADYFDLTEHASSDDK
eukprot:CAMPEP_0113316382 /NCGR_PEP_ID=MMETSP0010_2-20120614/11679_1 /TAXON_ID=216773 ORGANISM="Corethron hystrix, Strain 308" /NCGR_SAMPLE_ID=MMETSP0010_2 /ASSEMBLY_ACC=CAM_ASM_000155 /LENGTH=268 /DNA_ID=CAMNT_0000173085 /DNA_START=5 /DNA_END=812 /DNA_ORIENTATION=- /assembly_acc=CAM_ASM_000155